MSTTLVGLNNNKRQSFVLNTLGKASRLQYDACAQTSTARHPRHCVGKATQRIASYEN